MKKAIKKKTNKFYKNIIEILFDNLSYFLNVAFNIKQKKI